MQNKLSRSKNMPFLAAYALKDKINYIIGKKGIFYSKIFNNWESIIGSDLAKYSVPIKLSHLSTNNFILTIEASNSFVAVQLSFIASQVIERINTYLGKNIVNRIKIIQSHAMPVKNKLSDTKLAPKSKIRINLNEYFIENDEELSFAIKNLASCLYEIS